jgi:membrane protein HdeD
MQKNVTALILIILGLIVIAFPLLGLVPIAVISGFIVLFLGIGLLIGGIMEMGESAGLGILEIILGIIALILGVGFIVNPGLFSWLVGFIVWIVGLFLVIAGIVGVISKTGGSRWNGVIAIIIGLLYIVVGTLIKNPVILGVLIGLWLLITGILMLMAKE